jgi:hypothetical protein
MISEAADVMAEGSGFEESVAEIRFPNPPTPEEMKENAE